MEGFQKCQNQQKKKKVFSIYKVVLDLINIATNYPEGWLIQNVTRLHEKCFTIFKKNPRDGCTFNWSYPVNDCLLSLIFFFLNKELDC